MSKISYPKLVKNIADAFRIATGTTEPIAVGELSTKIGEAIGSGGGSTTTPTISCEAGVAEVILPVILDPVTAEINNSNIQIETSVALESEE